MATAMFNALHKLLEKIHPYSFKDGELDDWLKVNKYTVTRGTSPLIFCKVLSSITKVLSVRRLHDPTFLVVELDEEGNAMMRTVEDSSNFTTLWRMFCPVFKPLFQRMAKPRGASMGRNWSLSLVFIESRRKRIK